MKFKRYFPLVMALLISFTLASSVSSCRAKKEGCGLEDQLAAPVDKKTGELSTKRGSSGLFDKKRVSKKKRN